MKTSFPTLSELEVTAWMLVSALVALGLMLGDLVWRSICPEAPRHPRGRK